MGAAVVQSPLIQVNNKERGEEEQVSRKIDHETFEVPDSNAFGHSFRDYDKESERSAGVEEFYRINHINQTYESVQKKKEKFRKHDRAEMSIWECCQLLNEYVDESDPDLDEPQIEHLLQSAEAIRRDFPDSSLAGDTFPLGCAFDESIVHYKHFKDNPDLKNPTYNTKLGIYTENCGLNNVTMSWGHDEYMFMVMKLNKTTLPPAALFIVRFHSFYALHRNGAYKYLMNDEDKEMLKWVQLFNKYDLYSKSKVRIDVEKVKPYYLSLIDKYFPSKLKW